MKLTSQITEMVSAKITQGKYLIPDSFDKVLGCSLLILVCVMSSTISLPASIECKQQNKTECLGRCSLHVHLL